jgi:hypothetical protein
VRARGGSGGGTRANEGGCARPCACVRRWGRAGEDLVGGGGIGLAHGEDDGWAGGWSVGKREGGRVGISQSPSIQYPSFLTAISVTSDNISGSLI